MPAESGETPIPTEELAAPARRALTGAGYTTLEQLAESDEESVRDLHGIGPSALETIREALEAHGLSFQRSSDVARTGGASTEVSTVIGAPRADVYRAFLDPETVAAWLPPDGMTGHVHRFDPREGGEFRISLTYDDPADSPGGMGGKTSGDTDTNHGRFVELVPDERIVELVEFESDDPSFSGEMRITVTLADADGGTEVTYLCENVPNGIRPEDNEAGCRSSLQKLAALVE